MEVLSARQSKVAKTLARYAIRGNHFERSSAIEGLVFWATKKQVPMMIKLLKAEELQVNWPEKKKLIKALSRFPSSPVFIAIASQLTEFTQEDEAIAALIGFGSEAEQVVCQTLESHSADARKNAVKILQEIGTKRSLPALEKALKKEVDHFLKSDIRDAIFALNRL